MLSSIEERWRQTPNGSAANQHGANENQADPVLLFVRRAQADGGCGTSAAAIRGHVTPTGAGDGWSFRGEAPLSPGDYCVAIATGVYDLEGRTLSTAFNGKLTAGRDQRSGPEMKR